MKTIAILQLLLAVVPCRFQEVDEHKFYIYNVTSNYCIHKNDAFHCTKFNKFVKDDDRNYIIFKTKTSNSYSAVKNLHSAKDIEQVNVTFCKSLEKTAVTKNTLTIYLDENFCRYTYEKLRNGNFEVWTTDTCLDLYQAENQKSPNYESKNTCKNFTLSLQKKLNLANGDVCKATESLINYTLKYYDIIEEGYNKASNMKQVTSDMVAMPKTWYIYEYILGFTLYYDVPGFHWVYDKICRIAERNVYLLYKCEGKLTSTLDTVCKKAVKYNFRTSFTTATLPYDVKTFLTASNRCSYIQKWDEGYEINGHTKHVIMTSKLGNLTLKNKDKLCNEIVWYTNLDGYVVSEKELQFTFKPDIDTTVKVDPLVVDVKNDVPKQNVKIMELEDVLFYLTILLIFYILWSVFKLIVNLFTLLYWEKKEL